MEPDAILLYDGECGYCDSTVQKVLRRDKRGRFRFAPLQGEVGRSLMAKYGQNPDVLSTMALVLSPGQPGERMLLRGKAATTMYSMLGGWWALFPGSLRVLPAWFLDFFYSLVARNRFRISGRLETCRIPSPEERARFL